MMTYDDALRVLGRSEARGSYLRAWVAMATDSDLFLLMETARHEGRKAARKDKDGRPRDRDRASAMFNAVRQVEVERKYRVRYDPKAHPLDGVQTFNNRDEDEEESAE